MNTESSTPSRSNDPLEYYFSVMQEHAELDKNPEAMVNRQPVEMNKHIGRIVNLTLKIHDQFDDNGNKIEVDHTQKYSDLKDKVRELKSEITKLKDEEIAVLKNVTNTTSKYFKASSKKLENLKAKEQYYSQIEIELQKRLTPPSSPKPVVTKKEEVKPTTVSNVKDLTSTSPVQTPKPLPYDLQKYFDQENELTSKQSQKNLKMNTQSIENPSVQQVNEKISKIQNIVVPQPTVGVSRSEGTSIKKASIPQMKQNNVISFIGDLIMEKIKMILSLGDKEKLNFINRAIKVFIEGNPDEKKKLRNHLNNLKNVSVGNEKQFIMLLQEQLDKENPRELVNLPVLSPRSAQSQMNEAPSAINKSRRGRKAPPRTPS